MAWWRPRGRPQVPSVGPASTGSIPSRSERKLPRNSPSKGREAHRGAAVSPGRRGHRDRPKKAAAGAEAYKESGVDLDAASAAVEMIKDLASSAPRPEVVAGVGGFAGLFDLGDQRLLAAAVDGVGTKLEVAKLAGKLDTVGIDLVAMSANDVICTGAT